MLTKLRKKFITVSKYALIGLFGQCLLYSVILANTGNAQTKSIEDIYLSIAVDNLGIEDVFRKIEEHTDFKFAYRKSIINEKHRLNLSGQETSLGDLLRYIGSSAYLDFKRVDDVIHVKKHEEAEGAAQPVIEESIGQTVTGRVTSAEDNESLPGVNVLVKGTNQGTVTDMDGNYSIEVPSPESVLVFSSIGFVPKEVIVGIQQVINITLTADIQTLDEIVVVGYGTMKKSDLTGSVSSVSAEDFSNQPVQLSANILQGRAAGVTVTNVSGRPDGFTFIRVRGANSINGGNEPLYVVDGIANADLFRNLDPNDIQSMEVLKDASSTAIYGSRGANGVILVTTKKGREGKFQLAVETQQNWETLPKKLDVLSAAEYASFYNEYRVAKGGTEFFSPEQIEEFQTTGGTNWQDLMFRTAHTQNYKLSASGGSSKASYRISANIRDAQGLLVASDYKRYGLRTSVDIATTNWLTIGVDVNGAVTESNGNRGFLGDVVWQAITYSPTVYPLHDANGDWVHDNISSLAKNPYGRRIQNQDDVLSKYFGGNGKLSFKLPVKGLTFDMLGGMNYTSTKNYRMLSAERKLADANSVSNSHAENIFWQNTNQLSYTNTWGDHSLTATAVAELTRITNTELFVDVNNLLTESVDYWNLGLGTISNFGNGYNQTSLLSYVGRVMYQFKDKYMITATTRRDGSSKFQGTNKWGNFPSVALAWRASQESFISDLNIFDQLKVRGSWGISGNQAIDSYSTLGSLSRAGYNWSAPPTPTTTPPPAFPGYWAQNSPTPNLTWEKTYQWDLGIDMGFFNNRVNATFDFYVKDTKDLLLQKALPIYDGGGTTNVNIGKVNNRGFELLLDVIPVQTNAVTWQSTVNFSFSKNKVVEMGGDQRLFPGLFNNLVTFNPHVLEVGKPMGSIWGYTWLGIWRTDEADEAALYNQSPGDNKFLDVDGNHIINSLDQGIIGKAFPDKVYGWNNTISWKNFEINVFFQGAAGASVLNFLRYGMTEAISDARFITSKEGYYNYWTPEHQNTNVPNPFSLTVKTNVGSTQYLESTDYVRLRNLSVAYKLPVKTLLSNLQVSAGVQNLFTITNYSGYDPEGNSEDISDTRAGLSGGYPMPRTFTIGLRANF